MQAGVHDQPDGPVHVTEEHAEILVGIGVKTEFLAQTLRVERPALDVGIVGVVAAELGQGGALHGQRNLEVMPGNRLVEEKIFHAGRPEFGHVGNRDVENSRPATVGCARKIFGRRRGRAEFLRGPHLELRLRHLAEKPGHLRHDPAFDGPVGIENLLLGFERGEPRIGSHEGQELLQGALEAHLGLDLVHLRPNAGNFLQPDLMKLLGGQVRGGQVAHRIGVGLLASRQHADAGGPATFRQILVADEGMQPGIGGQHDRAHPRRIFLDQGIPFCGGQTGGQFLQRGKQDVGLRIIHHQRFQLLQHPLHENAGLRHALARTFVHVGDGRVHPGAEAPGAAQEVSEILRRLEGVHRGARRHLGEGQVHRAELVDRNEGKNLLRAFPAEFEAPLERVVAQPVGLVHRRPVHLGQGREIMVAHRRDLGAVLRTDVIGPDGLVARIIVTVARGFDGKQGQIVFVIMVEHRVKRGGIGGPETVEYDKANQGGQKAF